MTTFGVLMSQTNTNDNQNNDTRNDATCETQVNLSEAKEAKDANISENESAIREEPHISFDKDGTINLEMDPSEKEDPSTAAHSELPIDDGSVIQNQENPTSSASQQQWKKCTMLEIAEHKSRDDLWIVMHGLIYDVTDFLIDHPGGLEVLLDVAGTGNV